MQAWNTFDMSTKFQRNLIKRDIFIHFENSETKMYQNLKPERIPISCQITKTKNILNL